MGFRVLAALGETGYLINIARGSVVDESALADALTAAARTMPDRCLARAAADPVAGVILCRRTVDRVAAHGRPPDLPALVFEFWLSGTDAPLPGPAGPPRPAAPGAAAPPTDPDAGRVTPPPASLAPAGGGPAPADDALPDWVEIVTCVGLATVTVGVASPLITYPHPGGTPAEARFALWVGCSFVGIGLAALAAAAGRVLVWRWRRVPGAAFRDGRAGALLALAAVVEWVAFVPDAPWWRSAGPLGVAVVVAGLGWFFHWGDRRP